MMRTLAKIVGCVPEIISTCALLVATQLCFAADTTTAGEIIVEPPTLISLGFEWYIEGDDDRDAERLITK